MHCNIFVTRQNIFVTLTYRNRREKVVILPMDIPLKSTFNRKMFFNMDTKIENKIETKYKRSPYYISTRLWNKSR